LLELVTGLKEFYLSMLAACGEMVKEEGQRG
jgi:hypothetical protein